MLFNVKLRVLNKPQHSYAIEMTICHSVSNTVGPVLR